MAVQQTEQIHPEGTSLRHDISLSLVSKQNQILKENWHLTELT